MENVNISQQLSKKEGRDAVEEILKKHVKQTKTTMGLEEGLEEGLGPRRA
jgi:hypothetical protein